MLVCVQVVDYQVYVEVFDDFVDVLQIVNVMFGEYMQNYLFENGLLMQFYFEMFLLQCVFDWFGNYLLCDFQCSVMVLQCVWVVVVVQLVMLVNLLLLDEVGYFDLFVVFEVVCVV